MNTNEINTARLENADTLDVLIVGDENGGGAREHALLWKLAQAERIGRLCIAPPKAGVSNIAESLPIKGALTTDSIANLAVDQQIDLVVVSMDDWLGAGLVDRLAERGVAAFGPTQKAFQIESNKDWAKNKMKTYFVPTATGLTFDDAKLAHQHVDQLTAYPLFVKATGLCRGQGAMRSETAADAHRHIDELMVQRTLGEAGATVIIEEFLDGQEVSLHAITDGRHSLPLLSSQDHKQVFDNDPYTLGGGSGTIAPVPWFGEQEVRRAFKQVGSPIINGLWMEQNPFVGTLFTGLMVSPKKTNSVVEYNGRDGNPETQVNVRMLKSDLLELMVASVCGTLDKQKLEWHDGFAVDVVAMSEGYPKKPKLGYPIDNISVPEPTDEGVVVFHGGTTEIDGKFYSSGGRVFDVTAVGDTLSEALDTAYEHIERMHFRGMHYRRTIGQKPSPF